MAKNLPKAVSPALQGPVVSSMVLSSSALTGRGGTSTACTEKYVSPPAACQIAAHREQGRGQAASLAGWLAAWSVLLPHLAMWR